MNARRRWEARTTLARWRLVRQAGISAVLREKAVELRRIRAEGRQNVSYLASLHCENAALVAEAVKTAAVMREAAGAIDVSREREVDELTGAMLRAVVKGNAAALDPRRPEGYRKAEAAIGRYLGAVERCLTGR